MSQRFSNQPCLTCAWNVSWDVSKMHLRCIHGGWERYKGYREYKIFSLWFVCICGFWYCIRLLFPFYLKFHQMSKIWGDRYLFFNQIIFLNSFQSFSELQEWSEEVVSFRSSHQRCSVKKVFLEISQNSQENTCVRVSFLIKLQASSLQLY